MKSICNLLVFCSLNFIPNQVFSREVILIENQATSAEGEMLVRILVKKFNLPRELITLSNSNKPCEIKSEAIIHLCLEISGELQIRKINQYVVKNSLSVFLNQVPGVEQ